MKRVALALAATLGAAPLAAQEVQADSAAGMHQLLELVRSDFRTQKVAIVTAAMPFTEQQAAAFWPVYRQYELELTALWDQRLALIKDYAQSYQAMTDEKAKQLAEGALRLEDEQVKLRRKYHDRMSTAVGPVLAARFLQVENQIGALVSLQIAEEVPLIRKPE
ncbi:MAG TPA: hypothetical protein VD833_09285 [Vicinamibacterales bacterium]|nr:hypothetical protein [Vicinamibacterales bacterium]